MDTLRVTLATLNLTSYNIKSVKNIDMIRIIVGLLSLTMSVACAQKNWKNHNNTGYVILSKTEGSKAVLHDEVEHFFDKLSTLEMSIQMKDTVEMSYTERKSKFLPFLASEMMDFDSSEVVLISAVMDSAITLVNKMNPNLIKRPIKLIKTDINHYGPSVYYTREDGIYIPKDALEKGDSDELLAVMLHEISHIISRSDLQLKTDLYQQIGFRLLPEDVVYPEAVRQRILINPDGVNDDFYIPVTNKETKETIRVIPIITSNRSKYITSSPAFFDYLKFSLFAIDETGKVLCTEGGNSTVQMNEIEGFFEEIEDNTGYIIHPDEIIADNFMLLILAIEKNDFSQFSDEGKILLEDLKKILTSYHN